MLAFSRSARGQRSLSCRHQHVTDNYKYVFGHKLQRYRAVGAGGAGALQLMSPLCRSQHTFQYSSKKYSLSSRLSGCMETVRVVLLRRR